MKKYHVFILIILISAYGWLYYQKTYSGPDINDYFRAKSDFNNNNFSLLYLEPEKVVGQVKTFYGHLNENRIQRSDWVDTTFDKVVYLNKKQQPINYNCISPEVKVTGLVQQHGDFYYFASIENISGYQMNHDEPKVGMLMACQVVK